MVTVEVDEPLTPSPVTARVAFRVVRESLRNVVKHSRATRASVRLHQDGDRLLVDVSDDGVGFQPEQGARPGHLGQQLLRDTVADAGGHLVVTSAPGEGTRVSAALPL
jgi:signal transduction histidine kinase